MIYAIFFASIIDYPTSIANDSDPLFTSSLANYTIDLDETRPFKVPAKPLNLNEAFCKTSQELLGELKPIPTDALAEDSLLAQLTKAYSDHSGPKISSQLLSDFGSVKFSIRSISQNERYKILFTDTLQNSSVISFH